jgi:hypothetical protein
MSNFSSPKLDELLRLAEQRPLTQAEQAMLRELLSHEDGRLAASAHEQLRIHYTPTGQNRQRSPDELSHIAAQIDQQVARRARRHRLQTGLKQVVWAGTAVILLILFLLTWPFFTPPPIEPAVQTSPTATSTPTPTPLPTPTLRPNYTYVDLLNTAVNTSPLFLDDLYTSTVTQVHAQWQDDLYLPTQMSQSWRFIGATIHQDAPVFELAFAQTGTGLAWILSQAPIQGRALTPPLPVSYQPLPRIDQTNVYDDQEITVGNLPAYAYQYEPVYREGNLVDWVVYNTVTWQMEGQLFTLTLPAEQRISTAVIATTAHNLQLQAVTK